MRHVLRSLGGGIIKLFSKEATELRIKVIPRERVPETSETSFEAKLSRSVKLFRKSVCFDTTFIDPLLQGEPSVRVRCSRRTYDLLKENGYRGTFAVELCFRGKYFNCDAEILEVPIKSVTA
jgi:hypothetical protein